MDNEDKLTVFNYLGNVGFYDNIPNVGTKSARMKDAIHVLPKVVAKILNHTLPPIENIEDSNNLLGQGVKTKIPSNKIDIYTRLEILLGLKLIGHKDILTEASNLIDEFYKGGEIGNKH